MSEPVQMTKNTLSVAGIGELVVPLLAAGESERAATRYVEFFAAHIRNSNTRAAYARTATGFFAWCEGLGLALSAVQPVHVAAWVEQLGKDRRLAPRAKQQLADVRMLFDWLVIGQVVPHKPASAVRGPKHSTTKGKTHPAGKRQRR